MELVHPPGVVRSKILLSANALACPKVINDNRDSDQTARAVARRGWDAACATWGVCAQEAADLHHAAVRVRDDRRPCRVRGAERRRHGERPLAAQPDAQLPALR